MAWWDPVDWWNATTAKGGRIVADLKNWVLDAIRSAVNLVESDVQDVTGLAVSFYTAARGYTEGLISGVENDFRSAVHYSENLYNRAIGFAQGLYNQAVGLAERAAGDVLHWAETAVSGAVGLAESLYSRIYGIANRWVTDALHWAESAVGVVTGLAEHLYNTAIGWATKEAERAAKAIYNLLIADVVKPFLEAWKLLVKALDWVKWFAEHPFAAVHDIEKDVLNWSKQLPDDLAHELEGRRGTDILDSVAKWLG